MLGLKSSIFIALVALTVETLATPPACLLAAINTQENPADLAAVCGSDNASKVQETIANVCQTDGEAAQKAFVETCGTAGVEVAPYEGSSSSSASASEVIYTTASYDAECSCTKTAVITTSTAGADSTTVRASGSGTRSGSTATGAAGAESTGAASSHSVGSLAAAVIAVAGVVAVL